MTENTDDWRDRMNGPWDDWGPEMMQEIAEYLDQQDPEGFQHLVETVRQFRQLKENDRNDRSA